MHIQFHTVPISRMEHYADDCPCKRHAYIPETTFTLISSNSRKSDWLKQDNDIPALLMMTWLDD